MTAGVWIKKVWSDDDVVELDVAISDGTSLFRTRVYVDHQTVSDLATGLERLKRLVHGGLYDIEFGKFGPEFASGAFHARLHFYPPGRGQLCITARGESDWCDFSKGQVASSATLYLKSEPALLDRFIEEVHKLSLGGRDTARLDGTK